MTAGFRSRRFQPFRVAALVVATLTACSAQAQLVPPLHRVRSEDPVIAGLIVEAQTRSETFRRLVLDIDTTNGIVYVAAGKCRLGVRACLIHNIDVAGPNRILRVVVNPRRDREGLIGAMGHELQHAWEVLRVPGITTPEAMFFNTLALAPIVNFPIRFETDDAVEAGMRIEREVKKGRAEH